MPEGKHTPAPWRCNINEKYGVAYIEGTRRDGVNNNATPPVGDIAEIDLRTLDDADVHQFPRMSPEHVANARLISSAPDLLEALEMFVGSVTKRTENGNIYALGELHAAEEAARKAISKAKGEGSPTPDIGAGS